MEDSGKGVSAPIFSHEDLRRKASEFLGKYHPQGTIPVPVEEIVEFGLGIHIVPMPDLRQLLDVDGFLTGNLREIYVDEFVYRNRVRRYHFTLAHEVGHSVLHSDVYQQYHRDEPSKIEEWKRFVNRIPEKEHGWLEYQAYAFAGLVLVPREHLLSETQKCVERIKSEGLGLAKECKHWDYAWTRIAYALTEAFEVSSSVIEKRLAKDEIPKLFG